MTENFDASGFDFSGEWVDLETENNGTLRLRIIPANINRFFSLAKEDFVGIITACVVDWNIYVAGKKVPCTDENKTKYLSAFSELKITNPTYAKKGLQFETVGAEIIGFAQNIDNFAKK